MSDAVVAVVVSVVLLGPALGPGYVLSYDMVFVPRMPFTARVLGVDGSVPRAVPSDAVVAALSHVADAMVLQKVMLLALLLAAGIGAGRLVRDWGRAASAVAVVFALWNPYLTSRLWLGQWAILCAYAALPWLVHAAGRVSRRDRRALAVTTVWLAVSALTASGGLIAAGTAVLVVACSPAARPQRWRSVGLVAAAALIVNLPWLLPSLLRPGGWPADPDALDVFAARADAPLGTLGSVLTLGGTWNAQTMPSGRDSLWAAVVLLLMLVVTVIGVVTLLRRRPRVAWIPGLAVAAAVVTVIAVAASLPVLRDGLRALVTTWPWLALLRDGTRYLQPLVLLSVVGLAVGARVVADRVRPRDLAPVVMLFAVLAPMVTLVGAAWGEVGALGTASYPSGWAQARAAIAAEPGHGAAISLPWNAYHRYAWNADRTVYDPAGRWLPTTVITDDRLRVGDTVLVGEDACAAAVTEVLTGDQPVAPALAAQGIGWVVVTAESGVDPPPEAWFDAMTKVVDTPEVTLWRIPDPATAVAADQIPGAVLVIAVDLLVLGFVLVALVVACRPNRGVPPASAATMTSPAPPGPVKELPP